MKHHHLTRALALISLLAAAPAALAQTPALVPYQGRVQTGTPAADFTGTGQFKFALVDQSPVPFVQAAATVARAAGVQSLAGATFTVTTGGTGYTTAPAVTVSAPQVGGGVQATVTATVSGGAVTGFVVGTAGSGYTANPTLTIAAPPAPTPTIVWNNNGPVPAAPVNAVSLTVTNGLYSVLLGDAAITNMAAIPPSVFARPDIRLRVWFNGTQLSPDQRLAPNGYLPTSIAGPLLKVGDYTRSNFIEVTASNQQTQGRQAGIKLRSFSENWGGTVEYDENLLGLNLTGIRDGVQVPGVFISRQTGNVGIGTTSPTQAKLVVTGGVNNNPEGAGARYVYLDESHSVSNTVHVSEAGTPDEVSIYANKSIWSGTYIICSSDERIKTIRGQSDSATDLQTVRALQITDYNYKDTVANSGRMQKKLIAQQVEKVYPQAVNRNTNVVPDIYRKAAFHDGWVTLPTDLKKGERVRLLDDKNGEGIHEVLEVKDGAFRTAFQPAGSEVFVYGREVNDFRTVDYDAISMLNVSATQELARQLDAEKAAVLALQKANTTLEAENAALKAALAENASKDRAQDEKLATLAKLLEDRAPSAAVTTVTTQP